MSGVVKVFVVSPDTRSERRFDLHLTVEDLKVLCYSDYGPSAALTCSAEQTRTSNRNSNSKPNHHSFRLRKQSQGKGYSKRRYKTTRILWITRLASPKSKSFDMPTYAFLSTLAGRGQ